MTCAMLITVGVGPTVADGIRFSISKNRPHFVLFLVTKESKTKTLGDVVNDLLAEDTYACFEIRDENDVEQCALDFAAAIEDLQKRGFALKDMVADFTSGTKAMSAGLVFAGVASEVGSLSYVHGQREEGRVVSGSERLTVLEPKKLAVRREIAQVVEQFNALRFDTCLEVTNQVRLQLQLKQVQICVDVIQILAKSYRAWDRFDFSNAAKLLGEVSGSALLGEWKIKGRIAKHNGYLRRMVDEPYCAERAVELWNSAQRRAGEEKFDDAMARLYRLIEYVAQLRLHRDHGGIETGDLDMMKLPEALRAKYEKEERFAGKIEVGLKKSYRLLAQLGDSVGTWFDTRFETDLKKVLGMRNQSILAHGFAPVSKESYRHANDCVHNLMGVAFPKWEETAKVLAFPELDATCVVNSLGFTAK